MGNFAVGDLVVGNKNNGYTLTSEKCLLEVLEVSEDEHFTGKVVNHLEPKFAKNGVGQEVPELLCSDFHVATDEEKAAFDAATAKTEKEKALETYDFKAGLQIKVYPSGKIESTFNPIREKRIESDGDRVDALNKIVEMFKGKSKAERMKADFYRFNENEGFGIFDNVFGVKAREGAAQKLIDFFKEFEFEPNFRFANTLKWHTLEGIESGKEYIRAYFDLANNQRKDAIADKIKSPEFKEILYNLALNVPEEHINKRLKVYYGSQGTGKTTKAMEETDGRCLICNNSILPQDLLEDFDFEEGKPGFKGSLLQSCMEEGKMVVMDEFNLLPFETIRFLQGLLDGKKEFTYKGKTINIKDGFGIIGTMNLVVNGVAFGLPEPLVDRAYVIEKSQLTAKDLMGAL